MTAEHISTNEYTCARILTIYIYIFVIEIVKIDEGLYLAESLHIDYVQFSFYNGCGYAQKYIDRQVKII